MTKPIIIVSITEKEHSKILEEARVMKQANIAVVEWRADFAQVTRIAKFAQIAYELKKILQETPLLFTYRSLKEGGQGQFSSEDVYTLLHYIISQKQIDMVDIEFNLPPEICNLLIDYAKQNQIVTILSSHDFEKTPELSVLEKQFEEMSKFNTTIIKIATMANSGGDVLNLMVATKKFTDHSNQKVITIAMGKLGALSRIAGSITNSSYTFASFHKASAPGQLSYQRTKEFLDLFSI